MLLDSTRGSEQCISFEHALLRGFAPDGGLVLPPSHPALSPADILSLSSRPYWDTVTHLLSLYARPEETTADADDNIVELIKEAVAEAEKRCGEGVKLSGEMRLPAPGSGASERAVSVLELFHGPTLAFKDLGLQVIASLMDKVLSRRAKRGGTGGDGGAADDDDGPQDAVATLCVATSGDTGSAALRAFERRERSSMCVLYPLGRVSRIQELQMTAVRCVPGESNTAVFAVKNATSDSLDRILYKLFGDGDLSRAVALGSVNSFNVVRILVQMAHFVFAYARAADKDALRRGEMPPVTFAIPTGAFGNAVSAHFATLAGIPARIVVANGPNDTAHKLIARGVAGPPPACVEETSSRAIDIGVPYNVERFLYLASQELPQKDGESRRSWLGRRAAAVRSWMRGIEGGARDEGDEERRGGGSRGEDDDTHGVREEGGGVRLPPVIAGALSRSFVSRRCEDADTRAMITAFHERNGYVLDPHTAVAACAVASIVAESESESGSKLADGPVIIVATAAPAKFRPVVEECLGADPPAASVAALTDPVIESIEGSENFATTIDQADGDDACAKAVAARLRELHGTVCALMR